MSRGGLAAPRHMPSRGTSRSRRTTMTMSATLAINEEIERRRAAGLPVLALGFGEAGLPVHDEPGPAPRRERRAGVLRPGRGDRGAPCLGGRLLGPPKSADGGSAGGRRSGEQAPPLRAAARRRRHPGPAQAQLGELCGPGVTARDPGASPAHAARTGRCARPGGAGDRRGRRPASRCATERGRGHPPGQPHRHPRDP